MPATLSHLRDIRKSRGIQPKHIETITLDVGRPISGRRINELENSIKRAEPWLDEAADIARILLLPGIMPLVSPAPLMGCIPIFGTPLENDVELLKLGVRLPLSIACRIAVQLGLDDPMELVDQHPRHTQVWTVIERNERGAGVDECPWCLAPRGFHASHCLPENLWAPRSTAPYMTSQNIPRPQPASVRTRGTAKHAKQLKHWRDLKALTQTQLASAIGMNSNYYSRIERGDLTLSTANAEKIAQCLGCTAAALY